MVRKKVGERHGCPDHTRGIRQIPQGVRFWTTPNLGSCQSLQVARDVLLGELLGVFGFDAPLGLVGTLSGSGSPGAPASRARFRHDRTEKGLLGPEINLPVLDTRHGGRKGVSERAVHRDAVGYPIIETVTAAAVLFTCVLHLSRSSRRFVNAGVTRQASGTNCSSSILPLSSRAHAFSPG